MKIDDNKLPVNASITIFNYYGNGTRFLRRLLNT